MCGIWAVVGQLRPSDVKQYAAIAKKVQGHRGPDGEGNRLIELKDGRRILLGHQRLSIIDLSDGGSQPMVSSATQSAISFNGEIYNYLELATQLQTKPESASDTEVFLKLCDALGVETASTRANGMWAFIYVSQETSQIYIGRDRLGEKPLYIWRGRSRIIIASELKTVAALSGIKFRLNLQAVSDYVRYGLQDTNDKSWLQGIDSLPAGSIAVVGRPEENELLQYQKFWQLEISPRVSSFKKAQEEFRALFQDSIKLRLRADVPVGVTVSGGLDSSLILAEMVRQSGGPERIMAVSAIAPGQSSDESGPIARVTAALGVKSHMVDLTLLPEKIFDLMKTVTWHNDAPLGSFSNIAFYELMRLAHCDGIKVVLSGQGADESFCGYSKYFYWAVAEQLRTGRIDQAVRNVLGSAMHGTMLAQFNHAEAARYMPSWKRPKNLLGEAFADDQFPLQLGLAGKSVAVRQSEDICRYSVPYLTHYEDRNSMAHGVEVRLPFLDYRLVEFGIGLPLNHKIDGGWTKRVMRSAFEDMLPKDVIYRRDKKGFSVPQRSLMRGALRDKITELYSSNARIFKLGLINKTELQKLWTQFLNGDESVWDRKIFAPWALEIWLEVFSDFIE